MTRRLGLVLEQTIEHGPASRGYLQKLHAHAMRAVGFLRVELADPGHLAGAKQQGWSLHQCNLERDHRAHWVRGAAGKKNSPASHIRREPLHEGHFVGVAKLDASEWSVLRWHVSEYRMSGGRGQPVRACSRPGPD